MPSTSPLEDLVARIKQLPARNQRAASALLGATVADAASRPLHWIYNQETLDQIIGDSTEPEFWHENKSPFYSRPLGAVSAYNDTALASLSALHKSSGVVNIELICKSFVERFGAGTDYAAALARRKDESPVVGPWIHGAMISFLENYEAGQDVLGGAECNAHDGFCAALPVIALLAGKGEMWLEAGKVASLLSMHAPTLQMFHAEALLVNNFILAVEHPIGETKKQIESLYPTVREFIEEAEEAALLPRSQYISTVAKLGRACSLPGAFQGAILTLLRTESFVDAVRLNITAGGCNCGRASVIGACYGAKYGIDGIPINWLEKVENIEVIAEMVIGLHSL